jgi:hypothetical protein
VEGGHFVVDVTVKKILDAIYWWPIIFKDIHEFCRTMIVVRGLKD